MPWGLYAPATKTFMTSATIRPEEVPGPGYHWYRFGTHTIPPSCYLYFFWSWIIQLDLDSILSPGGGDESFTIWASIRFTGPDFPHGKADEPNAIWVERVVLERAKGP
jgi:hypothetical protein